MKVISANDFDWTKSFTLDFDLVTGLSENAVTTVRSVSSMADAYQDGSAAESLVKSGDPVVYEFYELGAPEEAGELAFGTTLLYPGKVGSEYFMTKGHFHSILDTSEVYYTLSGEGYMLMENPEGDVLYEELRAGEAIYVPRRYAHRMVNTGSVPLVVFFVFEASAGHDYGTIETKGFRKIIVELDGTPAILDNPLR